MTESGGYQLGPEIASGGMGTVFLGRSSGGSPVAIKRIHPHLAKTPSCVNMFRDEARVARAVVHDNVVKLIELVRQDDDLLLVLEYVEGVTLRELFEAARSRETPIPDPVVAALAIDLLRGLAAVHDARADDGTPLEIIHRDVSPQNVIVSRHGVAKLTDFGVAKAVERLQTTREGQVKGKLAYMAPERLVAEGAVDLRVDLYAVGVVIWELATLRRLFPGDDAKVMMGVITGAIDPPSDHGADAAWDPILASALATDPSRRPASAGDMIRAIERAFAPAISSEVEAWVSEVAEAELGVVASRRHALEGEARQRQATLAARSDGEASVVAAASVSARGEARGGKRHFISLAVVAAVAGAGIVAMNQGPPPQHLESSLSPRAWVLPVAPASPATATVVPSAKPVTAPVASSAVPAEVRAPSRKPSARTAPRATPKSCASPFYTDETGVKRVRRECL